MKPFLKWAGGKYKIIDKINEHLPQGNRLIEPFMGSGAVFMNTHYDNYLLGDSNFDLINVFKHLQEKGSLFIDYDTEFTRSIYKEAAINSFDVQRFIASQLNSRIKVPELLAVFQ